jgi:ferredoxin
MPKKRVVLTLPPSLVDQPVTYHLVKDFDLRINILRGVVTPKEQGRLVVELAGGKSALESGMNYLKQLGVTVESLAQDIKWFKEKCTHCTACIPMCPTRALDVDRETMEVSFYKDRCIVCELCTGVCPYNAIEILYKQ